MRYQGFPGNETSPGAFGLLAGLVVLILGLLVNVSCAHARNLDVQSAEISARYDAAVQINAACLTPEGMIAGWNGSGVIVDATHVLTAGHVAETEGFACSFTAEDSKGEQHFVSPLHILSSEKFDLASMGIVAGEMSFDTQPLRLGAVPRLGEVVCVATAFPRREYRCGNVMKPDAPPGDIRLNIVVEPGNSGSALYNAAGELVGIVVHTYPNRGNGQYISGAASSLAGHLKELLP